MPPLISFIIINYNTKNLLKGCIDSILEQTYGGQMEILFIDNASSDGSVAFVKEIYANDPRIIVIANPDNKGYAGAGNQGIGIAKGEYVVITNPDIRYEPTYFQHAIAKMEQDNKIAALTGKVLKYDFAERASLGIKGERSERAGSEESGSAGSERASLGIKIIDTIGIFIYRNRRVIDDGQGLQDEGQFDEEKEVFGISGACPLYRKSALEDVKIGCDGQCDSQTGTNKNRGEYLDNDFFMYKEDVDISWRFQLFGWKCWYYPKAVAYHGRGTGIAERFTTEQMLQQRAKMSPFQKKYGFINQRLMQIKNELPGNFWRDFFPIISREIGTLAYITFKEPYLWKSVWETFRRMPRILRKRREIMQRRRVNADEMRRWFREQSEYFSFTDNKKP